MNVPDLQSRKFPLLTWEHGDPSFCHIKIKPENALEALSTGSLIPDYNCRAPQVSSPPPATLLPALGLGDNQESGKTWGEAWQLCRDQAESTCGNSPQANLPAAGAP